MVARTSAGAMVRGVVISMEKNVGGREKSVSAKIRRGPPGA